MSVVLSLLIQGPLVKVTIWRAPYISYGWSYFCTSAKMMRCHIFIFFIVICYNYKLTRFFLHSSQSCFIDAGKVSLPKHIYVKLFFNNEDNVSRVCLLRYATLKTHLLWTQRRVNSWIFYLLNYDYFLLCIIWRCFAAPLEVFVRPPGGLEAPAEIQHSRV